MRVVIFIFQALFFSCLAYGAELPLDRLHLPPGFSIALYAYPVPGARSMTLGTNNVVFVGSREQGKVYAIVPYPITHHTKTIVIASGLVNPNGVAFYQGNLYVAETNRILRFDNIEKHLEKRLKPVVIANNLPDKPYHNWRYLRIGPDKKIYLSIGAPCNSCKESNPIFATIIRMNLDGSQQEIFAKGVRNSIGFDWAPADQTLWFTDNGRDLLGDDAPPDELNRAPTINLHFGFPFCHGKTLLDPEFGKGQTCSAFTSPVLELPAHVAVLGMRFYQGSLFPADYRGRIFIAEHGSWDRSKKIGYQVISVALKNANDVKSVQPFITGWLNNEIVWGRPVDVLEMTDGSLLVSDDYAGAIYRVTYPGQASRPLY